MATDIAGTVVMIHLRNAQHGTVIVTRSALLRSWGKNQALGIRDVTLGGENKQQSNEYPAVERTAKAAFEQPQHKETDRREQK